MDIEMAVFDLIGGIKIVECLAWLVGGPALYAWHRMLISSRESIREHQERQRQENETYQKALAAGTFGYRDGGIGQ